MDKSLFFFLLITFSLSAQSDLSDSENALFSAIRSNNLIRIDSILKNDKKNTFFNYGLFRKHFLSNSRVDSLLLFKQGKKELDNQFRKQKLNELVLGDYYLEKGSRDSIAIAIYQRTLIAAKSRNDTLIICEALKKLISVLFKNGEERKLFKEYSVEYQKYVYDTIESAYSKYFELGYLMVSRERDFLEHSLPNEKFDKLLLVVEKTEDKLLLASTEQLYGVKLWGFDKNYDSALIHYENAKKVYQSLDYREAKIRLFGILVNMSAIYIKWDKPQLALEKLYEAQKIDLPSRNRKDYILFFDKLIKAHIQIGNKDSAFYYMDEKDLAEKKSKTIEQAGIVTELETKYQTAKKERQILEEQQKTRANRNWLIAASLALLLGTGIAILLQKNTTKKRLLAEQEALLKQQRVENLLKEQELVSIDAMIAGQEKERQKVAGELHDDLGSLMATIKLHFDNASISKKDVSLQHAQKLLEEAYQKVRSMAHNKNSGVMSDQGLLQAIQKMAKTITETNAMKVTVEDFGMGERMENTLELSIFRMVQELVANAIKHAEATHVSIQLTQHEENLNIIVEDNGKGFDRSQSDAATSGIGLTTIEKRVEHLEGSFTVDSVMGKGTSILIDIPV